MSGALLNETAIRALAPYVPPIGPMRTWRFYQQGVYQQFHEEHEPEISAAYLGVARELRRDRLPVHLSSSTFSFGEGAWTACRAYLDDVEAALAGIIERRTTVEWLHLYRRLGVSLHPALGGKTDEVTVVLVREIAELAISKFGAARARSDLLPAGRLRPRDILGGHYMREAEVRLGSRDAAVAEARAIIRSNQLVMVRFALDDLLDLYRIEGLAYEYWRTTAALRTVGKGAGVRAEPDGFVEFSIDDSLRWLIEHYDDNRARARFAASLLGAWFPPRLGAESELVLAAAGYNGQRIAFGRLCENFGLNVEGPAAAVETNFYLAPINLSSFTEANAFIGSVFEKRLGFSLMQCALTLWALSVIALSPGDPIALRRAGLEHRTSDAMLGNLLNIAQRGYGLVKGDRHRLTHHVCDAIAQAGETIAPAAVAKCLDYMTLTPKARSHIGLWSRGRRFPLVPLPMGYIIDLDAIGGFLLTLFVSMRDKEQQRGIAFEKMWRHALDERGFTMAVVGEIEALDGKEREVDAAVRIGSTLYLMECRAIERPLDFELSKPNVMAWRQEQLTQKLEQVETLREFLIANPVGRNYDVSWASDITHFVVGPFEEFIWTREQRYWMGETPRIQSADAMLALLIDARDTCSD